MLEVCTGCRLHFGLMELAAGQPHRFAGLGLMVQAPRVCVQVGPKQVVDVCCSAEQEIVARVRTTAVHAQQALGQSLPAAWSIAAVEHPRLHSGLGLGTQLAAAVAAATQLATLLSSDTEEISQGGSPWRSVAVSAELVGRWSDQAAAGTTSTDNASRGVSSDRAEQVRAEQVRAGQVRAGQVCNEQVQALARISGRGKRSAVGLHGFLFGGLVQDLGQNASQTEPPATSGASEPRERSFGTRSCTFPSAWPIVLILSTESGDMCGAVEEQLITQAGASPNRERATMLELSDACMSAAAEGDFHRFVSALERYMDLAATLFTSVQAGRYRNQRIARRVALAQQAGLRGVGQSSWGPTVFGFADDESTAQRAAQELRMQLENESVEVLVTRAAHQGASWRQVVTGVQHAS